MHVPKLILVDHVYGLFDVQIMLGYMAITICFPGSGRFSIHVAKISTLGIGTCPGHWYLIILRSILTKIHITLLPTECARGH